MFKVGIVTADFNSIYTNELEQGALSYLEEMGCSGENIHAVRAPGAFELPILAKHLVKNHNVDGVCCFGVVIKGETDHYDYVCSAAQQGCLQVGLEFLKPVMFGVLTVDNHKQVQDRVWGKKGNKGREVASALWSTLLTLNEV